MSPSVVSDDDVSPAHISDNDLK
ncbi:hypothetical protein Tco_0301050, partial [Tanacetum coccineum]